MVSRHFKKTKKMNDNLCNPCVCLKGEKSRQAGRESDTQKLESPFCAITRFFPKPFQFWNIDLVRLPH